MVDIQRIDIKQCIDWKEDLNSELVIVPVLFFLRVKIQVHNLINPVTDGLFAYIGFFILPIVVELLHI